MMTETKKPAVRYLWYWQLPITWVPWYQDDEHRWLVIAEPVHKPGTGVFYIWLSKEHEHDEVYARRVAEALTRIYRA